MNNYLRFCRKSHFLIQLTFKLGLNRNKLLDFINNRFDFINNRFDLFNNGFDLCDTLVNFDD